MIAGSAIGIPRKRTLGSTSPVEFPYDHKNQRRDLHSGTATYERTRYVGRSSVRKADC